MVTTGANEDSLVKLPTYWAQPTPPPTKDAIIQMVFTPVENGIHVSWLIYIFNLFLIRNQPRISEDSIGIIIPLEW